MGSSTSRSPRRRLVALVLLGCSVLLPALPSVAGPRAPLPGSHGVLDEEEPCPYDGLGDLVPGGASARGVTDAGHVVPLTVLVLLDGIPLREAQQIAEGARAAYRPLAIDLRPTYRRVALAAHGRAGDGQPTAEPFRLIDEVRRRYPAPPPGFDLVHVLTSKDVTRDVGNDGTDELLGVARCVGGIRYEGQEFSVSEARYRYHEKRQDDVHVLGMTHEVAHLLGAHHHYGNCSEGRTRSAGNHGSCTVMFPVAVLGSSVFGTLEAAVVRGYAVSYA